MARGTPAVPNDLRETARERLRSHRIGSREKCIALSAYQKRSEHAHRTDRLNKEFKYIENKRIGGSKSPRRREAL